MSQKQPDKPCEHVQELIDFLIDNEIGIYPTDKVTLPENIRCKRCARVFSLDISAYTKELDSGYNWEEVF